MNQQVDNEIGGYVVTEKYRAHSVGGTTQYAEPSDSAEGCQTSRDGLGDSCEHGTKQVAAENKHAARLLDRGEIAVLLDRWDGVDRRGINAPTGQPRPQAERRVREDRKAGE
ncbi:MAG: hypothetical protein ACK5PR_01930 [bacterium]